MPAFSTNRIDQLETDLHAAAIARAPAQLQALLGNGVYVYGAGSFGRRIVTLLLAAGYTCLGFIDRKLAEAKTGVDGLDVLHPGELTPTLCAGRTLVVGIFNPYHDMGEIVRAMRQCGFADILWCADLPDALGTSVSEFWLSGRKIFVDQFPRIREAYAALSDETSRQTLESIIRFRALNDDWPTFVPSPDTQYLPPDLPGFKSSISFLDGGAYDGDTFRSLRSAGVEIKNWIAFEPDPESYRKLTDFARTCGTTASIIPCGLASKTSQLQFSDGQGTSSKITDNTETGITIQCIAVDEAFANIPIDYVKLDIEGAENSALEGMRATVAKFRPHLAVSAYHRPEDVWEIPIMLKSLLPDANIYLRQHYHNTYEVVAYAIPSVG